jgi:hypothetical protein
MSHLNCGTSDENRQANRQRKAGKASARDGMLPSYKERTKRETRGRKKRPTNHLSVERQTEVRRKRGTLFLPHKPFGPGLCGEGACGAVTIAMDHPSRGFCLPSQVHGIHENTIT